MGDWRWSFCALEIERRPRGASQRKAAPTFLSGQSILRQRRAAPWRLAQYRVEQTRRSRALGQALLAETDVGAALCCEAPRGRRSIYAVPHNPRQAPGCLHPNLLNNLFGPPTRWDGLWIAERPQQSGFFINRYKKGPAVPCGKPTISSLDNPLFFLRKKPSVHK